MSAISLPFPPHNIEGTTEVDKGKAKNHSRGRLRTTARAIGSLFGDRETQVNFSSMIIDQLDAFYFMDTLTHGEDAARERRLEDIGRSVDAYLQSFPEASKHVQLKNALLFFAEKGMNVLEYIRARNESVQLTDIEAAYSVTTLAHQQGLEGIFMSEVELFYAVADRAAQTSPGSACPLADLVLQELVNTRYSY